jgi:hypothetical protein
MSCDRLIVAKLQQLPPVGIDLGLTREGDEDADQHNTEDAEGLTRHSTPSERLGPVPQSVGLLPFHNVLRW